MKKVSDIISLLEAKAPSGTAESWDNVGLLVGDPSWTTSGAVVSIDLNPESLRLAKSKGWRLIVTHHPCIFPRSHGVARIVPDGELGKNSLIIEALRAGIAIAACHTNFDQCAMEVVDTVADGLGVKPQGRLIEKPSGSLLKLVVFVPSTHLEAVRTAICEAGAGQIGNYDFCTFGVAGEGTFRGREGAQPFIGRVGELELAQEVRLETIFPRGLKACVLKAMLAAHPYEEVAFDLYSVEQGTASKSGLVRGLGYGFWGDFVRPKSFSDVARSVRSLFNLQAFWVTGHSPSRNRRIRRLAFVAGKGASFVEAAARLGCDLMITGEAGYHTALDGSRRGVTVIELGHRESERFFVSTMRTWLEKVGLKCVEANPPSQMIWSGGKK